MKVLTDALKQILNSLAYANAGEYMTQRDKARFLNQSTADIKTVIEPVEVKVVSKARHIALYTGSELPSEVMDYVIETCLRLKNDLTVLTFESKKASTALLQPYENILAKAGINMQVANLTGDPITGLARYLRKHPEVAFLACKDSGYLGRSYVNSSQRKNALPVPIVVVATSKTVTHTPAQANAEDKASVA